MSHHSHPHSGHSVPPEFPIANLSKPHQKLLEIIRAEDPNAKISLPALAAYLRLPQTQIRNVLQDLIAQSYVQGTIRNNTLHLCEQRIFCHQCGAEYSNPRLYYRCKTCYRSLCRTCAQHVSVIACTHHPDHPRRMIRMPLTCPHCKTVHYNLQRIHNNDLRCPTCNTQFFFH